MAGRPAEHEFALQHLWNSHVQIGISQLLRLEQVDGIEGQGQREQGSLLDGCAGGP